MLLEKLTPEWKRIWSETEVIFPKVFNFFILSMVINGLSLRGLLFLLFMKV